MEDHGLVEIYNVMGQLILQADHKIEVLKMRFKSLQNDSNLESISSSSN